MNTQDLKSFINAPTEIYAPIPNTLFLEASNYGRIRRSDNMEFFGEVKYLDDMADILTGTIPIWDIDAIIPTKAPRRYFCSRNRNDRARRAEEKAAANKLQFH